MTNLSQKLSKELFYNLYSTLWSSIDWIFPPTCPGCGKQGFRICSECLDKLDYSSTIVCSICGRPSKYAGICNRCMKVLPNYTQMRSVFTYKGVIREAIHKLKYENDLGLAELLSNYLLIYLKGMKWNIDLIIPVPLNQIRLNERGYNQAALLSIPLALRMNAKYRPNAINRIKNTRSQVGLNEIERRKNVSDAFLSDKKALKSKDVLIIDDVTTTGATLNAVAHAAKEGGARNIYCLTLARAQHSKDNLQ